MNAASVKPVRQRCPPPGARHLALRLVGEHANFSPVQARAEMPALRVVGVSENAGAQRFWEGAAEAERTTVRQLGSVSLPLLRSLENPHVEREAVSTLTYPNCLTRTLRRIALDPYYTSGYLLRRKGRELGHRHRYAALSPPSRHDPAHDALAARWRRVRAVSAARVAPTHQRSPTARQRAHAPGAAAVPSRPQHPERHGARAHPAAEGEPTP